MKMNRLLFWLFFILALIGFIKALDASLGFIEVFFIKNLTIKIFFSHISKTLLKLIGSAVFTLIMALTALVFDSKK